MSDRHLMTLQEAADLVGKSVQTLRRLIKRGNLRGQRVKTPQGFHYLVEEQELKNYYSLQVDLTEDFTPHLSPIPASEMSLINQHEANLVEELQNSELTSQNEDATSQKSDLIDAEPKTEILDPEIQNREFKKILEQAHEEKMFLYHLISQLQSSLEAERRAPKSIWARLFRFFFG